MTTCLILCWSQAPWLVCGYATPHLSIRTSIDFIIWATAARLLDRSTPAGLCSPRASLSRFTTALSLDHFLIDTDHCRLGTPHKSCSWGDDLTQSFNRHNLAPCQTHSNPYAWPFFLLLTHQLRRQHVHLLPNISHPLTGAMMKR